ncbi:hypothetical protein RIF29_28882 [Crotalaria pallida]|uniref:Uncharacterized protein n=1 Tax=Crotalaria pallida TaxID=3830 RepID=A0AAN9HVE9_CROPI
MARGATTPSVALEGGVHGGGGGACWWRRFLLLSSFCVLRGLPSQQRHGRWFMSIDIGLAVMYVNRGGGLKRHDSGCPSPVIALIPCWLQGGFALSSITLVLTCLDLNVFQLRAQP